MKLLSLILIISAFSLCSCQLGQKVWENSSSNSKQKMGIFPNKIDSSAKYITAKYARNHNLSGNVIALYPDFHLRLLSTELKGVETISVFEISSKNGLERDQLHCTTKDPEKQHFYIEDMHFFYHSEAPGKINIYIPPILLAKDNSQSNNTL